jgi:DNA-binding transcriptional regulator YdaS (Cro superfamily)
MNNPIMVKAIDIAGGQTNLAKLMGVSQASIHKLLTRKSQGMRLKTALMLSHATGISLNEIILYELSLPMKPAQSEEIIYPEMAGNDS